MVVKQKNKINDGIIVWWEIPTLALIHTVTPSYLCLIIYLIVYLHYIHTTS